MTLSFAPCIVIPVYNHASPLPGLVARLLAYGLPIVLVDDGSAPACAMVLDELVERHPDRIQLLRHTRNRGKGGAVKTGFSAALARGFTHAVQIDADGQHDPGDVERFLAVARRHPDAVVAGLPQFDASIPRGRYYARYLTHVWVWINTLSLAIRDSMCGYRVYPLAACERLLRRVRLGDRMDFDVEILVRLYWEGVEIEPLPTRVRYPEDGLSHFRLWEDNVLLSSLHARLFFGMLLRLPRLLARHFR